MPGADDLTPSPASKDPQDHGLPGLSPDAVEQANAEKLDNIVPTSGYKNPPIVALGGSAGGLAALQHFFGGTRADTGFAYVVIMHLSAEHESILAELLQRTTRMPVCQVQHSRIKVEPDHVYVIPPAKHLSMADGHLNLSDLSRPPGKHVAVDLFFRTLADAHGPRAAAIVLSGADSDGAIGIKRIKERGGLTIAQDPKEAEHDSMPRAAIGTNMVDWVLPVADMPDRLAAYWNTESRLRLPPEDGVQPAQPLKQDADLKDPAAEQALHDCLGFLRTRTGRDFTYYKRATILRRIGRRMQVNGIVEVPAYLDFLRTHPGEAGALLQDLLISVTNFFRDRDSFEALRAEIPRLFHGKKAQDTIRVWVAACATGEEAYSVAMLLCEHAGTLDHPPKIQVFATDLDEAAIQAARDGLYTDTIVADVSDDRLRRFFTREHGGYRIKRELREMVLFALHDLLKDSPFSRLDLVTCRNLLIYLNHEAQQRALEIFHFALHAQGVLFLGSSESVDEGDPLFAVTDKKHRLFVRRSLTRARTPSFAGPGTLTRAVLQQTAESPALPTARAVFGHVNGGNGGTAPSAAGEEGKESWSELHFKLIERYGPPSVLVNREYDIVHLAGYAGRFLQFNNGELTTNLLRLIHPTLRIELRAALFQASQAGVPMEALGVPAEIEGARVAVDIRVAPAQDLAPDYLLVIFEAKEPADPAGARLPLGAEAEPVLRQLERELEQSKGQLRDTIEQADASSEELKASNEELQAMNEELRSATEELETGREELQSINEELSTVNQELKSKVDELGRSNSDLQNLMAATQIATVFLDRTLSIQRYTPPAVALFNLIPTDVGRPLSDLTPRLDYPALTADAERVLTDLAIIEVEVGHADGRFFLSRMLPYRTTSDHIAGVVMTFVDVTRRRRAEDERRLTESRFRAVADLVPDLLFSTDAAGQLAWCNERMLRYTGKLLPQLAGQGWLDTVHPEDREHTRRAFQDSYESGRILRNESRIIGADGKARWFLSRAEPLRDADGRITQWFGAKTDVDNFKQAEADLTASQERLRLIIENAREFAIFAMDRQMRITSWNVGAERLLGYSEREILDRDADMIFTDEDRKAGRPEKEAQTALASGRAADERWHQRKDGSRFWANGAMMRMNDAAGEPIGFVKILRDETEARKTRQALEQGREDLWAALQETEKARAEAEAANKTKDHFLAVLSHELRTPLTPVMMAVHLLNRNKDLPESAREALEMIHRNVQLEAHFIDDLLDVTRITRGNLEVVREPMDLHVAVQRAVEVASGDLEGKRQHLTVELQAAEHELRGDLTRLQQIFWNLLKNASKFTPQGGAIRVVSRNEPGRIIVEVSDTGIGFEAEAVNRIFQAFEQANSDVARQYGGLGLGLAISKATADAHGGELKAESKGRGQGAVFTVNLPLGN